MSWTFPLIFLGSCILGFVAIVYASERMRKKEQQERNAWWRRYYKEAVVQERHMRASKAHVLDASSKMALSWMVSIWALKGDGRGHQDNQPVIGCRN